MICQDVLTDGCHGVPLAGAMAEEDGVAGVEEEAADDVAAATEEELGLVVTTGIFEEVRAATVATGSTVVDGE